MLKSAMALTVALILRSAWSPPRKATARGPPRRAPRCALVASRRNTIGRIHGVLFVALYCVYTLYAIRRG